MALPLMPLRPSAHAGDIHAGDEAPAFELARQDGLGKVKAEPVL